MATRTRTDGYGNKQTYTALNTPFVQPTECAGMRDLAINTFDQYDTIAHTSYDNFKPLVLSLYKYDDRQFASCLPPGWAKRMMQNPDDNQGMLFSPAVCPQDYETFSIEAIATKTGPDGYYTQAKCCPSGYTSIEGYSIRSMFSHCTSRFLPEQTLNQVATLTDGQVTSVTSGIFIRPIWKVRWEASDLPSLSPKPPTSISYTKTYYNLMASTSTIQDTLVISRVTASSVSSKSGSSAYVISIVPSATSIPASSGNDNSAFLKIGLPVIFLSGLIGCMAIWWVLRKKRTQKRLAATAEGERVRAGSCAVFGGGSCVR